MLFKGHVAVNTWKQWRLLYKRVAPKLATATATHGKGLESFIQPRLAMKHAIRLGLVGFLVTLAAEYSLAAEGGPALATAGKMLFEDNFSRADMAPKWRVGKGFFKISDG